MGRHFSVKILLISGWFLFMAISRGLWAQWADHFDSLSPLWKGDTAYFQAENSFLNSSGPEKSSRLTLSRVFGPSFHEDVPRDFFQGVMAGDSVLSLELSLKLDFVPSSTNNLRWYLFSSSDSLSDDSRAVYLQLGQSGGQNSWQLWVSGPDTVYLLWQGQRIYSKEEHLDASFRVLYSPIPEKKYSGSCVSLTLTGRGETHHGHESESALTAGVLTWPRPGIFSLWVQESSGSAWVQDGDSLLLNVFSLVLKRIQDKFYSGLVLKYQTPNRSEKYHFDYMQVSSLSASKLVSVEFDRDSLDREDSLQRLMHRSPIQGNLIISEIMSDPASGESAYIEIHNFSDRSFLLSHCVLAYLSDGKWRYYRPNRLENVRIQPYGFWAMVKDSVKLGPFLSRCPENMAQAMEFPSLDHRQGWLKLLWIPPEEDTFCHRDTLLLDSVFYTSEAHHWLLEDTEGVALERIDPDRPAQDASAWISAAETCGFGTPGCENSHGFGNGKENVDLGKSENLIWIEPRVITPDNDGHNDYGRICWSQSLDGHICRIEIYDDWGRKMNTVASNLLLGRGIDVGNGIYGDYIRYDAVNHQGKSLRPGIYLMYVEIIRPDGRLKRLKYAFVVA